MGKNQGKTNMQKSFILVVFLMSFSLSQNISSDKTTLSKFELIKLLQKTLTNIEKFKKIKNNQVKNSNKELEAMKQKFRHYKQREEAKVKKIQKELSLVKKELLISKKNEKRSCQKLRAKLSRVEKKLFQKENIEKENIEKETLVMKPSNQEFIEPMEVAKSSQILSNEKDLPTAINLAMEKVMHTPLEEVEVVLSE